MAFQKATKKKLKLRCALEGPPGSGKTYTALSIGRALVGDAGRIAVIDTERGSASKYSDEFEFDVVELDSFAPATFVRMIREAEQAGYDLLIIDSLSHAWMGTDGMLDQVDKIAKRKQLSSTFAAWKDANPQERELWDTMLACGMHLIATLRTKTEYVVDEVVDRDGKKRVVPRKIGTAPIQREGLEYEFDVVADIDMDHNMVISKTRCKALTDGIFPRAGADVAAVLRSWLGHEEAPAPPEPAEAKPVPGKPTEAVTAKQELLAKLDKAAKSLGLAPALVTHVLNERTHESDPAACSEEDLGAVIADLREVYKARKSGMLTREHMTDMLQRRAEGSDPLTDLLTALREAEQEAANA